MNLFIDTETTGLPDFNKRASDPTQPHIVTFAALEFDDDWKEIKEHNLLVKPDGWEIPADMAAIHGITNEAALASGVPEKEVTSIAFGLIKDAGQIIAHNLTFDKFIIRCASRRHGVMTDADDAWWKAKPSFCTMKESTGICCLPGPRGFKYPKLGEAYEYFFSEQLPQAHTASADVRACARIFLHLRELTTQKL